MKMNIRNISLFWIALLFYPILYLLSAFYGLFGDSIFSSFICLIITQAAIFAGNGFSLILDAAKARRRWKTLVLQIISSIILFYVLRFFADQKYLLFLYAEIIVFFLGTQLYTFSYDKIVHTSYYIFSLCEYIVVAILIRKAAPDKFHPLFFYSILTLSTFIFMFIKNRININSLMKNRNYNEKYLPANTKKNNNKFVFILCIIFSAAIFLIKPVTFAYHIIGKALQKVFKEIIYFLRKLFDSEIDQFELPPEDEEEVLSKSADGDSKIILYIFYAVILIVIVVFIVKNFHTLLDILKRCYLNTRRKLIYLLTKESKVVRHTDNIGYTDTEEDVVITKKAKKDKSVSKKRLWKKNLIKYKSMKNSEEKFRFGYGLFLSWLEISGKKKKASETVNETAQIINSGPFTKVTEAYNPIRYGNHKCSDENISQLDSALSDFHNTIH